MNRTRRTELKTIYSKIRDIKSDLDDICLDESHAYDSLPENLQFSERAEQMSDAIDNMDDAIDALEEAMERLKEVF